MGFAAVHPEDRPQFMAHWERALQDGMPMEREIRLRRADGEYFWFLHPIVPFRGESGHVVKWIATVTDIHALKQSEESLRDERKQVGWQRGPGQRLLPFGSEAHRSWT